MTLGKAYMRHSPAQVIETMVKDLVKSVSELSGWEIVASSEPQSPDQVITIYDTHGRDEGRSMIDGKLFKHYGISVRVRANNHPMGWQVATIIEELLSEVYRVRVVIDGNVYRVNAMSRINPVIALGKDPKQMSRRVFFTINCFTSVTPLTNN